MGKSATTLLVLCCIMLAIAHAPAQPAPSGGEAISDAAASAAERVALLDLRLHGEPMADDYLLSARLFELIQTLRPEDPELVRRTIAAAWSAGASDLVDNNTRKLVRLDPADTVAQLRLITGKINALQTVEQRLKVYDKLLGDRGDRLDPSVRSRLALDAALLMRETGNLGGFAERLALAMQLDATNKDAASIAIQFYSQQMDDPAGQFELLINLLYADPVDPQVLATIAATLGKHGAFKQSRRFFRLTDALGERMDLPTSQRRIGELLLTWLVDGPEPVLEQLGNELRAKRDYATMQYQRATELDLDLERFIKPEDVRLGYDFETLRALASDAVDDRELLRASMTDLTTTVRQILDTGARALARSENPAQKQQIAEEIFARFSRVQAIRSIVSMDTDIAAKATETLRQQIPEMAYKLRALRMWEVLHAEGPERALEEVELAGLGRSTLLVQAVAHEMLGNTDLAVDMYLESGQSLFGDAIGAWAYTKVAQLAGPDAVRSADGSRMAAFVDRIPEWFDRMILQPGSFMMLRAVPGSLGFDATHSPTVRVEIENLAPIPLGFGSDRTISSRFLLAPSVDQSVTGFRGVPQPEVIELDRRLRLNPQQRVIVTLPADPGYTGWLLDAQSHATYRQRWRLVQDFRVARGGAVVPGPVALTAETPVVQRRSLPESRMPATELAAMIRTGSAAELHRALLGALAQLVGPSMHDDGLGADETAELADALRSRFEQAAPHERVLILALAPTGRQEPGLVPFDQRVREIVAQGQSTPIVSALAMLTRVHEADDPALANYLNDSSNAALVDIARIVRGRLETNRPHYALVGPSVVPMGGASPSSVGLDR